MKSGKVLFAMLTALFIALLVDGTAACQVSSINDCIQQSGILQLQQNNPSVYCLEAPRRAKTIFDCIADCQFTPNNDFIQLIANVDAYCLGADSQCERISERYNNFTSCYDGGLSSVVSGVIDAFNSQSSQLYASCRKLAWGRNCQLSIAGSCSFLITLQSTGLSSDYLTTAAFYLCGAESGGFNFTDNRLCSNAVDSVISDQCDVICDISRATSVSGVCAALQSQANCLIAYTNGCSSNQGVYVAPRVASYWAANELLGCNIQINGIIVRARDTECSIGSLLSACFNLSASGFGSLDGVKQLLTMQFPISQICNLLQSQTLSSSQMVTQCVAAMVSCPVPLGQVYNWPVSNAPATVYADDRYNPLLGPFAVNAWGLQTLLSNIELFTCQATGHVQCATTPTRASTTTTTTTPTPTISTTTTTSTSSTTTSSATTTTNHVPSSRRLTPVATQRVTPLPVAPRTTPQTTNKV